MAIPINYSQENFQREPFGNNAFDFEQRGSIHPEPYLRIAPLREFLDYQSALEQIKLSQSPAFEIFDEEKLKSHYGLQDFLVFPNPYNQTPIFVFDNHNHAFFFWHWHAFQNQLPTPFSLIHIDQHKDSRIPAVILDPNDAKDEQKLYQYTNEMLNVGNFIPPAIKTGLISEVINVDSSESLQKLLANPLPEHYILDLDLDFFAPDLDYLNNQLKNTAIKKALSKASITTIATSPYFIDHSLALNHLHSLFPL